MRLAFVIDSLNLGGAERQAVLFAEFAKKRGHEVAVFAHLPQGLAGDLLEGIGVPVFLYPEMDSGRSLLADLHRRSETLAGMLKDWSPDVVSSYMARPNLLTSFSWKRAGARGWVWNQRDRFYGCGFYRLFFGWRMRTAHAVVANGERGAHELETLFHLRRGALVVPNALVVNPSKESPETWRRLLSVGKDDFVAVMVANLHPNKSHEAVVRAWKLVADKCKSRPILVLAGKDYGIEERLKTVAERSGIAELLRFPGRVSDVPGLLAVCDVGVLSSRSEGYSNAVMEYGAAGLPVVGSDIPGISEAIAPDCRARSVFPVDDAGILAERILAYAGDAELRRCDGGMNRDYILSKHSPEQALGKLLAIAESICEKR